MHARLGLVGKLLLVPPPRPGLHPPLARLAVVVNRHTPIVTRAFPGTLVPQVVGSCRFFWDFLATLLVVAALLALPTLAFALAALLTRLTLFMLSLLALAPLRFGVILLLRRKLGNLVLEGLHLLENRLGRGCVGSSRDRCSRRRRGRSCRCRRGGLSCR